MDRLQVKGNQIVDSRGHTVRLRGTAIGGWMNMENFINGYPGVEHQLRATFAEVLGPSKAHFFFERWLDYFLAEDDIQFIKACGANVIRPALNYRHFERDDEPFKYVEAGFERLDRLVQWCTQHGVYVILDLHAVQGWQNPDWHCDNPGRYALTWQHPHFQDRFVSLWEELARRYKGNATIAAYDVMNEPMTAKAHTPHSRPNWHVLNQLYRRVVSAIRAIDPDHIIFLEGDGFASRFDGLDAPFADNLACSSHNYTAAGFGPGAYPGVYFGNYRDRDAYFEVFRTQQGTQYAQQHHIPLWVGEFGSVYNGLPEEVEDRLQALDDQIDGFEQWGAHWTTWTYKDVGVMGWVTLDPESEYMQRIAPILDAKRLLAADSWMGWLPLTPAKQMVHELARLVERTIGGSEIDPKSNQEALIHTALAGYVASLMQPAFAKRFAALSEAELDRVLQSFALKHCKPHQGLIEVVKKHMARPA